VNLDVVYEAMVRHASALYPGGQRLHCVIFYEASFRQIDERMGAATGDGVCRNVKETAIY
jgi:hypothetical protein